MFDFSLIIFLFFNSNSFLLLLFEVGLKLIELFNPNLLKVLFVNILLVLLSFTSFFECNSAIGKEIINQMMKI